VDGFVESIFYKTVYANFTLSTNSDVYSCHQCTNCTFAFFLLIPVVMALQLRMSCNYFSSRDQAMTSSSSIPEVEIVGR